MSDEARSRNGKTGGGEVGQSGALRPGKALSAREQREAQLAARLRDNLKRRKAQQRARGEAEAGTVKRDSGGG